MKKPLHSFFNLGNSQPKPPTFGQVRAQQLHTQLMQALTDRRKLARAEAAASDPLDQTYRQKGTLVENKIDRLQKTVADTKE